jgi:hypothetical protein
VNGDSYADVIVGAPGFDAGDLNEGAAFIFLGSAAGIVSGISGDAATQLESNVPALFGPNFGDSVASAGDVNGDGYADVIVGAPNYVTSSTDVGASFVFHGSASGVADGNPATAATRLTSGLAGDVVANAHGYADVIVGAHQYDSPESNEGAAFVFLGSATGIANGKPGDGGSAAPVGSDECPIRPVRCLGR